MKDYDPLVPPDPDAWLALDEGIRAALVEAHHRAVRVAMPKSRRTLHALMHVIVENQLAMADTTVLRALDRLMGEGLSRHDALHAIGSVVAVEIQDLLNEKDAPDTARSRYYAAVEQLSAASWRATD